MKRDEKSIDDVLRQHLPWPEAEITESNCVRVLESLRSRADFVQQDDPVDSVAMQRFRWRRTGLLAMAAGVLFAVVAGAIVARRSVGTLAHVESIDGALYQLAEGKVQTMDIGQAVNAGESIQSNVGAGGALLLADGSRVEMRSKSEVMLERANDGIRIRLKNGSVIVNAATQQHGRHLYVQTKDVSVAVVGTVFLVNAEKEGSRVAVIEGEVRVRKGTTEMKLRPGEQVATDPLMETLGVKEEVSWSRDAGEHVAMLQFSARPSETAQSTEPRDTFELATVRPLSLPSRGSGAAAIGPTGCHDGGWIGAIKLDPNRIIVPAITLATLVRMAYAQDCFLVEGGPEWIRSDRFDIQGIIPPGSPTYTRRDLTEGKAVKLQNMLQNLLSDRFKLVVRREMKEMPVYALVVGKALKMKLSDDQTPPVASAQFRLGDPMPRGSMSLIRISSGDVVYSANAVPIWELTKILQGQVGRPVIDKTELKGLFDIRLQFAPEASPSVTAPGLQIPPQGIPDPLGPMISTAVETQLGLKLEPIRAPVEVLVIDRVERPSEN